MPEYIQKSATVLDERQMTNPRPSASQPVEIEDWTWAKGSTSASARDLLGRR